MPDKTDPLSRSLTNERARLLIFGNDLTSDGLPTNWKSWASPSPRLEIDRRVQDLIDRFHKPNSKFQLWLDPSQAEWIGIKPYCPFLAARIYLLQSVETANHLVEISKKASKKVVKLKRLQNDIRLLVARSTRLLKRHDYTVFDNYFNLDGSSFDHDAYSFRATLGQVFFRDLENLLPQTNNILGNLKKHARGAGTPDAAWKAWRYMATSLCGRHGAWLETAYGS
jgi:hypothetical protein